MSGETMGPTEANMKGDSGMTEGQKQVTARKLKALAKMMSTPDLIEACRANDRHKVHTGLSRAQ